MPLTPIYEAGEAFASCNYREAASIARQWLDTGQRHLAQRILFLSLYHLDEISEALKIAEKCIAENPSREAYNDLGLLLSRPKIARHKDSADAYQKAYALSQGHKATNWGLTEQYLRIGNWDEGWPLFVLYGRGCGSNKRSVACPRWDTTPLGDGKLLVWSDQELGDTIQFSRFVPHLSCSNIRFECPGALESLFTESFPGVEVVATIGEKDPRDMDLAAWTPLTSLPAILKITKENLPNDFPYLKIPAPVASTWQSRIQSIEANPKVKVGIKCAGEKRVPVGDDPRSCKLDDFRPICEMEGVSIFSLQKDDPKNELDQSDLRSKIINLMPEVNSFADTAAIIQQMDIVVSVDTSVAHLAGALGKMTCVLLREDPDYRWGIDASQNLWYPSTVQCRQTTAGQWSDPVAEVVEKVGSFIAPFAS